MYTSRRGFLTNAFTRVAAATAQEAPELSDEDLAAFVESVELVIVEAYATASASGKLSPAAAQLLNGFAAHHREHAAAMARDAGGMATGKAHPQLSDIVDGQLQDAYQEKDVLQVAFDLENAATATHLYVLGATESGSVTRSAASILPAEAQHATVIGQLMGKALEDVIPAFENQDRAVDPTKFPISTTTTAKE